MYMVVGLFALQFGLSIWNGNPPKIIAWYFIFGAPVTITLKPLIGLVDNIGYLGSVVLFFIVLLPRFTQDKKNNYALLFLTMVVSFFLLKPEARHTNIFLPFMGFMVVAAFPERMLSPKLLGILFFMGIFLSKVWYPVHWAWFPPGYVMFAPGGDMGASFQQFPAQHYFMFQGPMMSHAMYFLWILVFVLPFLYVRKLVSQFPNPTAENL